jgi:hypothetical protein
MRKLLSAVVWLVLISLTISRPVWAGGSDSVRLPPLKTPEEKLAFLIEIRQQIPKLFSESARYDINLFSLLDDEVQLLEKLKSEPKYLQLFAKKTYSEITVTPPAEGLEVRSVKIKPEALQQWREQLGQFLQVLKSENKGTSSPERVLEVQLKSTLQSLGHLTDLSVKSLGGLLAKLGKEKANQKLFNEKIGKSKDLDLKGRLALALKLYDQFPEHPISRDDLEKAIQRISAVERLKVLAMLQVILHRPGQEMQNEESLKSWQAAEASLNQLGTEDLVFFQDKQDALTPLVEKHLIPLFPVAREIQAQMVEEIYKNIDSYAKQTEEASQRVTEEIRLTEVPPVVGIFRGCTGGDCSSQFSFPYPNDPHERVFFIEDTHGELKGYVSATEVMATEANGEPSLYVITISGKRVSGADTELIFRALDWEKSKLGVKSILLPEPSRLNSLINFPEPRGIYEKYTHQKPLVSIQYQDPDLRRIIEQYQSPHHYNQGEYDHMKQNEKGVILKFHDSSSKKLKIHYEVRTQVEVVARPLNQIQNSEILEFLLELKHSGRNKLVERMIQIPAIESRINQEYFIKLTHLLKECQEKEGASLTAHAFENQVQLSLSEMGLATDYLKGHPHLIYPGLVRCQDAFSQDWIDRTSKLIVKDMKESETFLPEEINLFSLKEEDRKALFQSGPFTKYLEKNVQKLEDQDLLVRYNALTALGAIKPSDARIHSTIAERLKDKNFVIRSTALYVLGIIKPSDARIHLAIAERLEDKIPDVRSKALDALGEIKPSDARIHAAIAECLKDFVVRLNALYVLGEVKPSDVRIHAAIAEHLKDQDSGVRYFALSALVKIKPSDTKIRSAIAEFLKDQDLHVISQVLHEWGEAFF